MPHRVPLLQGKCRDRGYIKSFVRQEKAYLPNMRRMSHEDDSSSVPTFCVCP